MLSCSTSVSLQMGKEPYVSVFFYKGCIKFCFRVFTKGSTCTYVYLQRRERLSLLAKKEDMEILKSRNSQCGGNKMGCGRGRGRGGAFCRIGYGEDLTFKLDV